MHIEGTNTRLKSVKWPWNSFFLIPRAISPHLRIFFSAFLVSARNSRFLLKVVSKRTFFLFRDDLGSAFPETSKLRARSKGKMLFLSFHCSYMDFALSCWRWEAGMSSLILSQRRTDLFVLFGWFCFCCLITCPWTPNLVYKCVGRSKFSFHLLLAC